MSLVTLIVIIVCLGVLAYLINAYAPMDARLKQIAVWVIIIVALFIVASAFGVCAVLKSTAVPSLK